MDELKQRIEDLEGKLNNFVLVDKYEFSKLLKIMDGRNIITGKTTGTKIATTTDQKIGFFNKAPVIQQTTTSQTAAAFVANTSGIVDDTATWGGYTIGDLVAILKAFGLIA